MHCQPALLQVAKKCKIRIITPIHELRHSTIEMPNEGGHRGHIHACGFVEKDDWMFVVAHVGAMIPIITGATPSGATSMNILNQMHDEYIESSMISDRSDDSTICRRLLWSIAGIMMHSMRMT